MDKLLRNRLDLQEAPAALLDDLFAYATLPDVDQGSSNTSADTSYVSGVNEDGEAGDVNADVEFFMSSVDSQLLTDLATIIDQDYRQTADYDNPRSLLNRDFWQDLTMASGLLPDPSADASIDSRRSSCDSVKHQRRSSVRFSLSVGTDTSSKCLVAVLYKCVQRSLTGNYSVLQGVLAARCYLILLTLPGTMSAYSHVFSTVFIHEIVRLARECFHLLACSSGGDSQSSPRKSADGKKSKKLAEDEVDFGDDDGLFLDDLAADERMIVDQSAAAELPQRQPDDPAAVMRALVELIGEMPWFFGKLSLKGYDDIYEQCVSMLMDNLQLNQKQLSADLPKQIFEDLQAACFSSLTALAAPSHHQPLLIILKGLLPVIAMKSGADYPSIPSFVSARSEQAVHFLLSVVLSKITEEESEDDAAKGVYILLQHMTLAVPDRADFRSITIKNMTMILKQMSEYWRRRFVGWMLAVANNIRGSTRSFGVEFSGAMFSGGTAIVEDEELVKQMLKVILVRCSDKLPSVRTKALIALSDLFSSKTQDVVSMAVESFFIANHRDFLRLICDRMDDEKSAVRKASIVLAHAVVSWDLTNIAGEKWLSKCLIQPIQKRFRDGVMSIRKQAINSLSQLLDCFPSNKFLRHAWFACVLNCVHEQEQSVQADCVSSFHDLVLSTILDNDAEQSLKIWQELEQLAAVAVKKLKGLLCLISRKYELALLAKQLMAISVQDPSRLGPWIMLDAVATFHSECLGESFVKTAWQVVADHPTGSSAKFIMAIIYKSIGRLSPDYRGELKAQLTDRLLRFQLPDNAVPEAADLLRELGGPEDSAKNIIAKCEQDLLRIVSLDFSKAASGSDKRAKTALLTLGEINLIAPHLITGKIVETVQAVIASDFPDTLKAIAFIVLGKFCLLNEDFARSNLPVFARELNASGNDAVSNNCLIVLCDLCKRYTRVVDTFMPVISDRFTDPSPAVREHAIIFVSKLLREDYLKWKGSLFFKFVVAVVDGEQHLASLAKDALLLLHKRDPALFFANFVDTIMLLNGNRVPRLLVGGEQMEKSMFTAFVGPMMESKRHELLSFLVRNFTAEQKFQMMRKLCTDVLSFVLEGKVDITIPEGGGLLTDTLHILSSKDIKASVRASASKADEGEEDAETDDTADNAKLNLITSKLHSQISRKIAVENIIPIVIRLKRLLEAKRSPLLRNLMLFLRDLVRDFRVEMEDVTAGDRQLARELEFDLRQLKETDNLPERQVIEESNDDNVDEAAHDENIPPVVAVINTEAATANTPVSKGKQKLSDPTPLRSCLSVPRLKVRGKRVCFVGGESSAKN